MKIKEHIKLILKIFKVLFFISIILTMVMFWYGQYVFHFTSSRCPPDSNVAVIRIYGEIVTYGTELVDSENEPITEDITSSETILEYINEIKDNEDIKAVIIEIDSGGGSAVASDEITDALKELTKPTVAVIRSSACSGAYSIATGADRIYANRSSEVGGIGVTMSYLDYSQKHKKEGIIYQELSSSKFKNTGDPDKDLTLEERELLMRDIKKLHRMFIEEVSENRNLDIELVEGLADGSTMLSQDAKENGLIDEVGNINDAKDWLRKEFKIKPKLCVY